MRQSEIAARPVQLNRQMPRQCRREIGSESPKSVNHFLVPGPPRYPQLSRSRGTKNLRAHWTTLTTSAPPEDQCNPEGRKPLARLQKLVIGREIKQHN